MSKQKLTIGLASFGLSGQVFHAPFIYRNEKFNLKYIVERSKQESKRDYPSAQILLSFQELIQKKDLDIVVVNTPTYLHFSMAKEALLSGKHVVLEKPMATNLNQAKELIALARERNLTLAVFQNRRLESGFKTLKNLVDNQTLGELSYFKSHFNRNKPTIGPKKWKEEKEFEGAGIFFDLAPHLIDQALTLFGNPLSVESIFKKEREDSAVEDYFLIQLKYQSELLVELEAGMTKICDEPKYILKGTKGTYSKKLEDPQEDLLRKGIFPELIDSDFGFIETENQKTQVPNVEGSYGDFYENLSDALHCEAELLIKPEEILQVMEIMEACLKN